MSTKKTLTLNGLLLPNFIYLVISIGMIFVGAYLTNHYFNIHFPDGLSTESALCNISNFWGCDKAANSQMSVILGMPTSVFGIIMGVIGIITAFAGKEEIEQTTKTILLINLIGCLILFIYSLISLKSLCPMCTVYYVLSAMAYFMFHKYSEVALALSLKVLGIFSILVVIPLIGFNVHIGQKQGELAAINQQYVSQFKALKNYGDPKVESQYKIHMGTSNFTDAPIRISIFSDFECPYCKKVSDIIPQIIATYKNKVNIQYMFYPLDASCNSGMKAGGHVNACSAAYLAACDKTKFVEVHDYIFENQSKISYDNLKKWAKKFSLPESCFNNKEVQDHIQQTLNAGPQFQLRSTPTIIVNGKKLEGALPFTTLQAIFDSLIK